MKRRHDSGSVSVELVLMTPVLMVLVLFVVLSGRSGEALVQVQHAADQGARAASQASLSGRRNAGVRAALDDLHGSGIGCQDTEVSVDLLRIGKLHAVNVKVSCAIDHNGLELLKLSRRRVAADSTEVVDYYRAD